MKLWAGNITFGVLNYRFEKASAAPGVEDSGPCLSLRGRASVFSSAVAASEVMPTVSAKPSFVMGPLHTPRS